MLRRLSATLGIFDECLAPVSVISNRSVVKPIVSENYGSSLLMCSACRRQALIAGGGLSRDPGLAASCTPYFSVRCQRVAYTNYPVQALSTHYDPKYNCIFYV